MSELAYSQIYAASPAGPLTGQEILVLTQTEESVGIRVHSLWRRLPVARSGNHTLEAVDEARYQRFTHAGEQTLTLPAVTSDVYQLGAEFRVCKRGTGDLVLSIPSGVTVNPAKGMVSNRLEPGDAAALVVVGITGSDPVTAVELDLVGASEASS